MSGQPQTGFGRAVLRIRNLLGLAREQRRPERPLGQDATLDEEAFSEVTGLPVSEIRWYVKAMTHRSMLRGKPGSAVASNERLEFLGDAVLGFVTAEHLFRLYPNEDEGFLTRLRAKLVNGKALASGAQSLGLDSLIMVSDNLRQQAQTKMFTSIMADAMEALIGAIYLDQGMDAARKFIVRTLLNPLDLDQLMRLEDNHKSLLLEFAQARGWPQPVYRVRAATGPSHERSFTVEAMVQGRAVGTGEGASKKQAEQLAAAEALGHLRSLEEESSPAKSLSTKTEQ